MFLKFVSKKNLKALINVLINYQNKCFNPKNSQSCLIKILKVSLKKSSKLAF